MKQIYEYEALTSGNQKTKGVFQGTQEAFEKYIRTQKITVIKTKIRTKELRKGAFNYNDFYEFIEELYYLINSGMDINSALKLLKKTAQKQTVNLFLTQVQNEIKNGNQLAISIRHAAEEVHLVFDEVGISFLATSEETGNIKNGLLNFMEYLKFKQQIKSDVKNALTYPLFLLAMSFVAMGIIFFFILPKFATIFSPEEFEKLPSLSYGVLTLGNWFTAYQTEILAALAAVIVLSVVLMKKTHIDWMQIFSKIPLLSQAIMDLQLAIVYGIIGSMLEAGLELDKALKKLQNMTMLPELKSLLTLAYFELKKGIALSESFSMNRHIPAGDIALLTVAENSATLDKAFKTLSERHKASFNNQTHKLVSLIEPIVIVLLGIFIAVVVISILMAVLSITDVIG
jgi:type II secretory pathway component PulF